MECDCANNIRCWNLECTQPKVRENRMRFARAEGTDLSAYVIYPEYRCTGCKTARSALTLADMAAMGIPIVILKQCPVVPSQTGHHQRIVQYDYDADAF
jgi:hypothetical protein